LPVSPPRKRAKTSSSTPNLKSPSIRTPSLLKKISFNFKICIYFQTGFHEEASVVEVFQDVLDKLSDVGKKDKLLKFFKLVQDGKFSLNNIAFELFLDIVEWFDSNGFPHLFGVEDPVKMSLSFFGPDINRMKQPPNNFLPNQKNWRVDGEYLI
jgi:hypothetical protein